MPPPRLPRPHRLHHRRQPLQPTVSPTLRLPPSLKILRGRPQIRPLARCHRPRTRFVISHYFPRCLTSNPSTRALFPIIASVEVRKSPHKSVLLPFCACRLMRMGLWTIGGINRRSVYCLFCARGGTILSPRAQSIVILRSWGLTIPPLLECTVTRTNPPVSPRFVQCRYGSFV